MNPADMPTLQTIVRGGRKIIPRGWAPLVQTAARLIPNWQSYRAETESGDHFYLDLREKMCLGIFFQRGQPHERGTEALLDYVLKRGDTFVDVGANLGFYTRMASSLVGDVGQVYAFEPMPAAYRLLRMNTSDLTNVTLHDDALSDREGVGEFFVRDHGDASSLLSDGLGRPIQVGLNTLDRKLSCTESGSMRVDFIKIDVEGAELSVLRGATKTIQAHQPVVYFEFLSIYAAQYGFTYADFAEFFKPFDYSLHWINHDGKGCEVFGSDASTYIVALPESKRGLLRQN